MRRILTLCALAAVLLAGAAAAGPYSIGKIPDGYTADPNPYDASVPGVVDGVVNSDFVGWASGYVDYLPSDEVGVYGMDGIGSDFCDPAKALGEVTADNFDIVSLGDLSADEIAAGKSPGEITLTFFDHPISNGAGADFAVFENGFVSEHTTSAGSVVGQMFAELAYIEVSSDGVNFARFPSLISDDGATDLVGAYGTLQTDTLYNLAGKHANAYGASYGTPFNLDDLLDDDLVLGGLVDLTSILYVKVVDIPGSGDCLTSDGDAIYDAWVTWGSGGFDLEAIGVLNSLSGGAAIPEPMTVALFGFGLGGLCVRRLRRRK